MLRVLVKVATFVNGTVHKAGEEILILDHLFSKEVHEILEKIEEPKAEPAATEAAPAAPAPAAPVAAAEEKTA